VFSHDVKRGGSAASAEKEESSLALVLECMDLFCLLYFQTEICCNG